MIAKMFAAGVAAFRMNMSHGKHAAHAAHVKSIRALEKKTGRPLAILADLQGPKLRIGAFANGPVTLKTGAKFTLDSEKEQGDAKRVTLPHKEILQVLKPDQILLLDDGKIRLRVGGSDGTRIVTEVLTGGPLSDRKGVNVPDVVVPVSALTDKDRKDLTFALEQGADWIALSFVQRPEDVAEARRLIGGKAALLSKIEKPAAIERLDELLELSDGVMVARGDLAVEIGDAELVGVQKHIIRRARALNRFVITATQMMESMIHSPQPTRAEVSDVANAVLAGSAAVMLSAETAVGEYPVETVQAMDRIILGAERTWQERRTDRPINDNADNIDEVIAMAAMQAANRLSNVTAIIAMTESGNTPRLMSRLRSGIPIYAFTPYPSSQRRVAILRGVRAIPFDSHAIASDEVNRRAVAILAEMGVVQDGDRVLITKGNYNDSHGGTNTLKVIQVGGNIQ